MNGLQQHDQDRLNNGIVGDSNKTGQALILISASLVGDRRHALQHAVKLGSDAIVDTNRIATDIVTNSAVALYDELKNAADLLQGLNPLNWQP